MSTSSSSEESPPVSPLFFSETSEEEDEEGRVIEKNKNYLSDVVPNYGDETFFSHFRVSKEIAYGLATRFHQSPSFYYQCGPNGKLTATDQVLIFLWYCGHQTSSFRDVGDRFGISLSALHKVVHRLTRFVSNLSPGVIKWPDAERKAEAERAFAARRMAGVLGAIDGTHIKIDRPEEDADSYINRKGYFSIQAQVVCDDQRRILDLFVGYPGSVHDARVFNISPLGSTLREKCGDLVILGDSAYPCRTNIITPYPDRGGLTEQQRRFNVVHAKNRYVVEHCFGLLKQKFRQLYHVKLRKIADIVHFIRACCVLHNLALDDEFPEERFDEFEEVVDDEGPNEDEDVSGQTMRDRMAARL